MKNKKLFSVLLSILILSTSLFTNKVFADVYTIDDITKIVDEFKSVLERVNNKISEEEKFKKIKVSEFKKSFGEEISEELKETKDLIVEVDKDLELDNFQKIEIPADTNLIIKGIGDRKNITYIGKEKTEHLLTFLDDISQKENPESIVIKIENLNLNGNEKISGIRINYGTLNIKDIKLENFNNKSQLIGGAAVYLDIISNLIIGDNVEFINNNSLKSGGAINSKGPIQFVGNDIFLLGNSSSENGGAISVNNAMLFSDEKISFKDNVSKKDGGAIYSNSLIRLNSEKVDFTNNSADNNGGAICTSDMGILLIKDIAIDFIGNSANNNGGAIFAKNFSIDGKDIKFIKNRAKENSAIDSSNLMDTNSKLKYSDGYYDEISFENYLIIYNSYIDDKVVKLKDDYLPNMNATIKINANGGLINNIDEEFLIELGNEIKELKINFIKKEGYKISGAEVDGNILSKNQLEDLIKLIENINENYKNDNIDELSKDFKENQIQSLLKSREMNIKILWEKDLNTTTDPEEVENPSKPNKKRPKRPETEKKVEKDKVIEKKHEKLNKIDHFAYINGYPDGSIKPEEKITREEVAAVFYRLLTEEYRDSIFNLNNDFNDVEAVRWSNKYISTLSNGNIINGYGNNDFRPEENITRAEVIAIVARFENIENIKDEEGHWAENYIDFANKKGWIKGYSDGSLKSDECITRAEFITIVNNVLERGVKKENILSGIKNYKDLDKNDWYYEAIVEATNGHLEVKENNIEIWKELKNFNYDM